MKIYVGNLTYDFPAEQLRTMFEEYGAVESAELVTDRMSGQSKGFGFVEMKAQADAERAIKELNGKSMGGRNLNVNIAKPKTDRGKGGRSKGW